MDSVDVGLASMLGLGRVAAQCEDSFDSGISLTSIRASKGVDERESKAIPYHNRVWLQRDSLVLEK